MAHFGFIEESQKLLAEAESNVVEAKKQFTQMLQVELNCWSYMWRDGSDGFFVWRNTKSNEDDYMDRPLGKGEQVDGNSMESSKSTEEESEDENQVEAAETAELNQKIKRILTEVLLKARFCLDVEVTEKEIERMVMEALRAEYIANDKFNHQLYEPEGMKNNYNSLPHYQGCSNCIMIDSTIIIMANVIRPNHVDDLPVVELNQPDVVPVIPEPVLVDEDKDPKKEEFEEEEEPQKEEDIDIDDEEDKNEPELTFSYEEADPLNPPPPASDSEHKDAIEVEDTVEPEDDTIPASIHEVGESSMITKITKPESIKELEVTKENKAPA
ncbi:putative reverse transcriptase domain-containing protein [Tanacetum coccineum]